MQRVSQVCERAKKFNIVFNPEKCKFGLMEVEYIGHVIDSQGLSFSQAKKYKVDAFSLPATVTEMKSFLGLASYFRDHVRGFTELAQPLRQLIEGLSNKHHRLK